MAIIIEEEKRGTSWFFLAILLAVAGLSAAAVYYAFFSETPLITSVMPSNLQTIKTISSDKLKPDDFLNNPVFKSLKQTINPIDQPSPVVRLNPFKPLSVQSDGK
ncbi:MAG: hypothetical protein NTW60_04170 [Candidatus Wolfebacteria bacterium]|nr:hypothetical protein [Candidatus Wolfebacteria bacterium]